MKFKYDRNWIPPAPFISIQVMHHQLSHPAILIPAKLDTAADVSAIPDSLIQELQLQAIGDFEVEGYDNHPVRITAYGVSMSLNGWALGRLEVISISSDYVLLGRDVLNQLRLLLDGPGLFLEILDYGDLPSPPAPLPTGEEITSLRNIAV